MGACVFSKPEAGCVSVPCTLTKPIATLKSCALFPCKGPTKDVIAVAADENVSKEEEKDEDSLALAKSASSITDKNKRLKKKQKEVLKGDDVEQSGRLKFRQETFDTKEGATKKQYNKEAAPKKPLLKSTSYVGTALLTLAKKHKDLQPVAFMLGAVTAQALGARALKLDCTRIARLLEQVESMLVRLGEAAPRLGHLDELMDVLDDAMNVLYKLKAPRQNLVDKDVAYISQNGLLGRIRDRLVKCVQAMEEGEWQADCELSDMLSAAFNESAAVAAAVESVGLSNTSYNSDWDTPESSMAVIKINDLLKGDSSGMWAPDPLLDATDMEGILEIPEDEAWFEFDDPGPLPLVINKQPEMLNAAIMHTQVGQMAMMMDHGLNPKAFMDKWPLAHDEAGRVQVINDLHLLDIAEQVKVEDVIEQLQVTFKGAYVAAYIVGWQSNHLIYGRADGALLGKEPGSVIEQRGRVQARKFSLCQHTIHAEEQLVRVPLEKVGECFDGSMFANPELCAMDEGVADQAKRLGAPGTDPLIDEFVQLVQKGGELIAAGLPIEHVGTCIKVQGHKVGTLCVLYPKNEWDGDKSKAVLVDAADTVAARLAEAAAAAGYSSQACAVVNNSQAQAVDSSEVAAAHLST